MFLVSLFERSSCEACAYSNVWSMGLSLEQALYWGDGVQSLATAWRQVHGYSWWVVWVGRYLMRAPLLWHIKRQQLHKGKV